jgi:hypothetical protein
MQAGTGSKQKVPRFERGTLSFSSFSEETYFFFFAAFFLEAAFFLGAAFFLAAFFAVAIFFEFNWLVN